METVKEKLTDKKNMEDKRKPSTDLKQEGFTERDFIFRHKFNVGDKVFYEKGGIYKGIVSKVAIKPFEGQTSFVLNEIEPLLYYDVYYYFIANKAGIEEGLLTKPVFHIVKESNCNTDFSLLPFTDLTKEV